MDTHITVQGNLVGNPEQHTVANGQIVVRFRVASNTRRFDKVAGEFRDGDTLYIGVACWRGLGVNVMATVKKGDSVLVHGRLQYREYTDQAGNRRNSYEIDAISVGPDLNRYAADVRRPQRAADGDAGATPAQPQVVPATEPTSSDPVAA
jgi:single-strand DNA-binding protein